MTRHAIVPLLAAIALQSPASGAEPAPAGQKEKAAAPALPPTPKPGDILTVDELLTKLETADASIRTLKAEIVYDKIQELQNDKQTRIGELLFRTQPNPQPGFPPRRSFLIDFTKLFVDGQEEPLGETYVFDGELLAETDKRTMMFQRRRLAAPGSNFDPFRVNNENALIPIPVGQRKDDILASYNVKLLAAQDGLDDRPEFRERVSEAYQLHLSPKVLDDPNNQFRWIRLWYEKGTLLPLMTRAQSRSGDDSVLILMNVQLNAPEFPDERISVALPPRDAGYTVQVDADARLPEESLEGYQTP